MSGPGALDDVNNIATGGNPCGKLGRLNERGIVSNRGRAGEEIYLFVYISTIDGAT